MLLLIDTNIIFNNWFLRSPQFALLANFCRNTGAKLMLPQVVIDEVDAKFKAERSKTVQSLQDVLRRCTDLSNEPIPAIAIDMNQPYSFVDVAANHFQNVEVLSYDLVEHAVMVKKAIAYKRPFRESEKGYRDCLMWLSVLQHLARPHRRSGSMPPEHIAFINQNTSDFCDKNDPTKLHQDLLADLDAYQIKNEISMFTSLRAFIDARVDSSLHSVEHRAFVDELDENIENAVEDGAIAFLKERSLSETRRMLDAANFESATTKVIQSVDDWSIWEGLEDGSVLDIRKLDDERLYVDYSFNLRMIELRVGVDAADFHANRSLLEHEFNNFEIVGDTVYLDTVVRCDFAGTLTINIREREVEEVGIDSATIRSVRRT